MWERAESPVQLLPLQDEAQVVAQGSHDQPPPGSHRDGRAQVDVVQISVRFYFGCCIRSNKTLRLQ